MAPGTDLESRAEGERRRRVARGKRRGAGHRHAAGARNLVGAPIGPPTSGEWLEQEVDDGRAEGDGRQAVDGGALSPPTARGG